MVFGEHDILFLRRNYTISNFFFSFFLPCNFKELNPVDQFLLQETISVLNDLLEQHSVYIDSAVHFVQFIAGIAHDSFTQERKPHHLWC